MSQWRLVRRMRACSPSMSSKAEALAGEAESDLSVSRTALSKLFQRGVEVAAGAEREVMIFNLCLCVYLCIDR
jgi:hypothetical protein